MKFSKMFSTFNEWLLDQLVDTGYKQRIVRLHGLYPEATLSQLRGHASKAEKMLSKNQAQSISKRSWTALSPKEKLTREKSLEVLREVRRNNKSLSAASKDKGLSLKTVLQNTSAFKKVGNRWISKTYDHIPRVMKINEKGRVRSIEITDSRTASIIGRYHNAVKKYIETGDTKELAKFEGKTIKDSNGNLHVFETDTETLEEINEAIEEPEFYDIYSV